MKLWLIALTMMVGSGTGLDGPAVPDTSPALVVRDASAVDDREPVVSYLPDGRVLVLAPDGGKRAGAPVWTIDAAITPALRDAAGSPGRTVPMVAGIAPASRVGAVADLLEASGAEVTWTEADRGIARVGALIPGDRLSELLDRLTAFEGHIVFADLQTGARLQNGRSAGVCQSGAVGNRPIFDQGLLGQGQIIGLMDTGIDADSCYFDDPDFGLPAVNGRTGTAVDPGHRKILAVDFWWTDDWPDPGPMDWDSQNHGTHTAGSAAGDASPWGVPEGDDGMAPAARLVIQDGGYGVDACADLPGLGCPVASLDGMLDQAWAQGVRIHSNSWGDAEDSWPGNRYTEPTADLDRFVWEHPEMVVVAAAGNAGTLGDDTVISPSTGKNIISVGALDSVDLDPWCPAEFSSRGWTHDERIKPDVMAPGSGVNSAANNFLVPVPNCDVRPGWGTSMASPTVAGLAALVRQYFMEGRHRTGRPEAGWAVEPSAALVKAALVASAVDLTTLGCSAIDPIPSRDQGWGLVRLDRVLWFEGDARRTSFVDRAAAFDRPESEERLNVELAEPGDLKVVLSWIDPPSTSAASVNLVNDLDLEVVGPDGEFLGNVFELGRSVTGGAGDRLNNVEVVWLPEATAGRWSIRTRSVALSTAAQGYALVVTAGNGLSVVDSPRLPDRGRSEP